MTPNKHQPFEQWSPYEKAKYEATQKFINDWTKKQTMFYNNETLVMSRNFQPGFDAGATYQKSEDLRTMIRREKVEKFLASVKRFLDGDITPSALENDLKEFEDDK